MIKYMPIETMLDKDTRQIMRKLVEVNYSETIELTGREISYIRMLIFNAYPKYNLHKESN